MGFATDANSLKEGPLIRICLLMVGQNGQPHLSILPILPGEPPACCVALCDPCRILSPTTCARLAKNPAIVMRCSLPPYSCSTSAPRQLDRRAAAKYVTSAASAAASVSTPVTSTRLPERIEQCQIAIVASRSGQKYAATRQRLSNISARLKIPCSSALPKTRLGNFLTSPDR